MSVGSICRRPAITAHRDRSALEAAKQMGRERVGSLVVTEGERPIGILTDRDIALQVLADGRDPTSTTVAELQTEPLVTVREELPLAQASDRMRTHGLRRVPVVDAKDKLVGMIASDDLVRLIAEELMALADVASEQVPAGVRHRSESPEWRRGVRHYVKEVMAARPSDPVRAVAAQMRDASVGSVIVVAEDGAPCGIVTDRNLALRVVAKGLDPDQTPIEAVMTPSLIRADASAPLQEVARLMSEHGIRRIPVTTDDQICGIVSYDDLLAALGRELHDLAGAASGAIARERPSIGHERQ